MSNTVTKTVSNYFNWDDASLSWDSTDANKSWQEFGVTSYDALLEEFLIIQDEYGSGPGLFVTEKLKITTSVKKDLIKLFTESVTFTDSCSNITTFVRNFEENIKVDSLVSKFLSKKFKEKLKITDNWIRHANAIYSDLYVSTNQSSLLDFEKELKSGSPVGFSDFTTYIPGYYEFKSALFRIVMRSTALDRIRLKELEMTVDVPDVFDRGQNTLNAGDYTTVKFNRKYVKAPNVLAIQSSGGIIATKVDITNINNTGFDVALKDEMGNILSGAVTWISEGY